MPQNTQSLNPAYLAGLFDGEGWVSIIKEICLKREKKFRL